MVREAARVGPQAARRADSHAHARRPAGEWHRGELAGLSERGAGDDWQVSLFHRGVPHPGGWTLFIREDHVEVPAPGGAIVRNQPWEVTSSSAMRDAVASWRSVGTRWPSAT